MLLNTSDALWIELMIGFVMHMGDKLDIDLVRYLVAYRKSFSTFMVDYDIE